MNGKLEEVCIIGLGYVGLTLAVAMANAGYRIHGVEKNEHIRNCIGTGKAHFSEVGLDEVLTKQVRDGRITCSEKLPNRGVASVYIVTVGTPLTQNGVVNLSALESVVEGIAEVLQQDDLVILRSTVKIGTTRSIAKRILDQTKLRYRLAFCPERTLEGKALQELTTLPQIVGGVDEASADRAAAVFSVFSPKIVRVDSLEAAEMVKLMNNTQRDLWFAMSNEIAEMCDVIGISAMQVIRSACEDYPRSNIALPGPVGGPCLEKDAHILVEGFRDRNYVPRLSLAGRQLNEEQPNATIGQIARKLDDLGVTDLARSGKIAVLGLAFKGRPETNDLRGTMAIPILQAARTRWPHAAYCAFDPIVDPQEFDQFNLAACASLEEAFSGASLVLIQNNHPAFERMPLTDLMSRMAQPALVYDYWNLFDKQKLSLPDRRYYGGLGTLWA